MSIPFRLAFVRKEPFAGREGETTIAGSHLKSQGSFISAVILLVVVNVVPRVPYDDATDWLLTKPGDPLAARPAECILKERWVLLAFLHT